MSENMCADGVDESKLKKQDTCPICSHSKSNLIKEIKTINPQSDRKVELRACRACGHWWHTPLPSQELLDTFYQNSSEYVVPKNYIHQMREATPRDKKLWEDILTSASIHSKKIGFHSRQFKYLELGVGSGGLFNFFKNHAEAAYGIEPGGWAPDGASNIYKHISELPNSLSFDMIIAHDVLEHLSTPSRMLQDLRGHANKNCIIHCTFPNKDSLKANIQKEKWHMIRPFGHLHYFSRKSTKKMFADAGWQVLELRASRISENTALDLWGSFDWSSKRVVFRLIKSLLLGQILLGKDQWTIIATCK